MIADVSLQQSPLDQAHRRLKAKMVPFSGWDMPVQYEGIIAEYWATRREVTVFDTSHMGEFFVEGEEGTRALDRLVTQPLSDMPFYSCRYGLLLNDAGGVVDDLIVYRLAATEWMVVVNAGTMAKDAQQFQRAITTPGAFRNLSAELGKLDIQGPGSRDLLRALIDGLERLEYYTFFETSVLGEKCLVSRTGYTGELGYEVYFPWDKMSRLWDELLQRGVKPAGLGARDVLRLEMGYPLYGHELSEEISPLSVGLNRFIDWNKNFVGKEALLKKKAQGVTEKLISFVSETRRSPRADHSLCSVAGAPVGRVTSGSFSPALQKGIGMGIVGTAGLGADKQVLFGEGAEKLRAEIVARPIYKNGSLKK